jgi:hypothetical protein
MAAEAMADPGRVVGAKGISRPEWQIANCGPFQTSSSWVPIRPEMPRAMLSNWHSIHKNDLARAAVAPTEQAVLAIAQGNAPRVPTVKIREYKDMEPLFVKGESDET